MKITEYKAALMFRLLLQECFENTDNKCPDNISDTFWNPVNSIDYKAILYGELFENDLISFPTYEILCKGILRK